MKSSLLAFALSFLLVPSRSFSRDREGATRFLGFDHGRQGVGLILGKPTGFRYSYWLNWKEALLGDLGYDFDGILMGHASYGFYLYDAKDYWKKKKGFNSFLFYVAPGIATGFRIKGSDTASSVIIGARAAGGLEYLFGRGAWSIRGELAGILNFVGRTAADFQGFVGLSYYWGTSDTRHRKGRGKRGDADLNFEGEDFQRDRGGGGDEEFDEDFD